MSKNKIKVFILPSSKDLDYTCSYFFSNKDEEDKTLDIFKIDKLLSDLSNIFSITEVNICGNLYTLSDFYFESLYNITKYYTKKISGTTDLTKCTKPLINYPDIINCYYSFNKSLDIERKIFENIKGISSQKIVNLKSLDIFLTTKQIDILNKINNLGIKSWEIIPYHQHINSNIKFENYSLCGEVVEH